MNIVFTLYDPSVVRAFENVIRRLCGLGHQVKVICRLADSDQPIVEEAGAPTVADKMVEQLAGIDRLR